jgi:hypothetical protein
MKSALRISLFSNLALLGAVVFLFARRHSEEALAASSEVKPPEPAVAAPALPEAPKVEMEPFRWSQLMAKNDYRTFVANLRAIGCPEPTLEDIVKGDVDRAFSFERNQLRLDGSGDGPWSQAEANQLLARLKAAPSGGKLAASSLDLENEKGEGNTDGVTDTMAPVSDAGAVASHDPLFLQNVNWSALGFDAQQQAAIAEVRQQFRNEVNGLSQNPNISGDQNSSDLSSGLTRRQQRALQSADNQLRDLLGAQAYAAYELQAYYEWYQPQEMAAAAGGGNLVIRPDAFILE